MKTKRITIGSIRRQQIVDAAVAVIAEQGLQNLSLSEIENKVGMSRGQLTYYFKAKEDILLAVFDRLVELMCQRQGREDDCAAMTWLNLVQMILEMILQQPPANPAFNALQFTFLAQIGHRADFRGRLAKLYEEWRSHMAESISRDIKERPAARPVSPRALATLTQAILHGLAVQSAADPKAINTKEIVKLCLDLLEGYLWPAAPAARRSRKPRRIRTTHTSRNGVRLSAHGVQR